MLKSSSNLYCSEQICIPPTFPYVLRQYAKAAIRTQPDDLLQWSAAYFRCLALNIPPPVKQRLEYPLVRLDGGLTAGWLRTLQAQFTGCSTVTLPVLWERWSGACLTRDVLIRILCLGGFENVDCLPWLHVVALSAGHLTDSIAATMILLCEILTKDPEGGAAAIPLDIFLDLYRFLANVDASRAQIIHNTRFTKDRFGIIDMNLRMMSWGKRRDAGLGLDQLDESVMYGLDEGAYEGEADMSMFQLGGAGDFISQVSCPSFLSQDGAQIGPEDQEQYAGANTSLIGEELDLEDTIKLDIPMTIQEEEQEEEEDDEEIEEEEEEYEPSIEQLPPPPNEQTVDVLEGEEEGVFIPPPPSHSDDKSLPSFTQLLVQPTTSPTSFKYQTDFSATALNKDSPGTPPPDEEDIFIDTVPGIGGVVPVEIIEAACEYFRLTADKQQGMIMPRNILHYTCPPLELLEY